MRATDPCTRPAQPGNQNGGAAVEFALVVLFFLTLVFGILELARAMYICNTLQEVTRRAAAMAARTDFADAAAMQRVREYAVLRSSAGTLAFADPVTDAHVRIDYMAITDTEGTRGMEAIPTGSLPASPAANRLICMNDPNDPGCIRLVRARICLPGGGNNCDRDIRSLKPKHVEALVAQWKEEGLSVGTMKNLMTAVRFWAEYIGKENVVRPSNSDYGIDDRVLVTNESKATEVTDAHLSRVTDPGTFMSLRLLQAFGLRREESIKIRPAWADLGDRLRLKDSWTKGGKYREIPISTAEQRLVLDEARVLAGEGSLIPASMRYKDQLNRFKSQCQQAGIANVHGQRHRYAQKRYEMLTGWKPPACGGPVSKELTPEQKARDRAVRLQISKELGHEREQITAVYLGR